jgi:hypothetical protein
MIFLIGTFEYDDIQLQALYGKSFTFNKLIVFWWNFEVKKNKA